MLIHVNLLIIKKLYFFNLLIYYFLDFFSNFVPLNEYYGGRVRQLN